MRYCLLMEAAQPGTPVCKASNGAVNVSQLINNSEWINAIHVA
jgi:hypothetical protein